MSLAYQFTHEYSVGFFNIGTNSGTATACTPIPFALLDPIPPEVLTIKVAHGVNSLENDITEGTTNASVADLVVGKAA